MVRCGSVPLLTPSDSQLRVTVCPACSTAHSTWGHPPSGASLAPCLLVLLDLAWWLDLAPQLPQQLSLLQGVIECAVCQSHPLPPPPTSFATFPQHYHYERMSHFQWQACGLVCVPTLACGYPATLRLKLLAVAVAEGPL
jgi:hypothetical protein